MISSTKLGFRKIKFRQLFMQTIQRQTVKFYYCKIFMPCGMYVHNYLMQKHLRCKKVRPSKVELYLEVNAWTNQRQQVLISENGQEAQHTEHINTTLDTLQLQQLLFSKFNCTSYFQPYPFTNSIFEKINKRT